MTMTMVMMMRRRRRMPLVSHWKKNWRVKLVRLLMWCILIMR